MIKGSLLCSIPTVKRFRAKKFFCEKSENGPRIDGFFWGGVGWKNFNSNTKTPSKSIPTWRKKVSILVKMWSPEAGK